MPESADDRTASPAEGSRLYLYLVSAVAAVGGLLFGYDTAVISGAGTYVKDHFSLNAAWEGFMVSSLLIGCMIGAGAAGTISDRLGRKRVLLTAAVLYVVSAVLAGLPRTLTQLVVARFVGGLAVGVSSMVSPMYIAEIAPARIRGALVTLNQMAIVTGILLAYLACGLLVDVGPNNWRWMFASAAVPALGLLAALTYVPESPRWLAKQGLSRRAFDVLARVGGAAHAENELAEIRESLRRESGSLRELFAPGLRVALLIAVVLAVLGQISGINAVIYYGPRIFQQAGFVQKADSVWATVPIGVTNMIVTVVSLVIIDRIGRRPLLAIGTAGMAVSMVLAGLLMGSGTIHAAAKVAIILLYVASFGLGVGGVVWVVIAEIFPNKVRGRGVAIATVAVWGACLAVAQTFPILQELLHERVFFIYAALAAMMCAFVLAFVPETKGRSLEEIERAWTR